MNIFPGRDHYEYKHLEPGERTYSDCDLQAGEPVDAEFTQSINPLYNGNRFIEALPLPVENYDESLQQYYRPLTIAEFNPVKIAQLSYHERMRQIPMLRVLRIPLKFQYNLEIETYRAMCEAYSQRFIMYNSMIKEEANVCVADSVPSVKGYHVLGMAGVGKTTCIGELFKRIPSAIRHTGSFGTIIQIPYLLVNCPAGGNMPGLYANIGAAVDKTLGLTNRLYETSILKASGPERKLHIVKSLIEEFAIGLIVLDEIQHLAFSGSHASSFENLLYLNNTTNVAFAVIGTDAAYKKIFCEDYMARRVGTAVDANEYCGNQRIFHANVMKITKYQWFDQAIEITQDMETVMFSFSLGVIDHMISIWSYVNLDYLKEKAMGHEVEVNAAFINTVIDKHFAGLREVLKKRQSKKRTQQIDAIFSAGKESLEKTIRTESAPADNEFLKSISSPSAAALSELESTVVSSISLCFPNYTNDQIIQAFKKVYSIKENRNKPAEEIIPIVVDKLIKISAPKKTKNPRITAETISMDLRGVMQSTSL